MKIYILLIIGLCFFSGCSKADKKDETGEKSTTQTVIDGFTGRTAVNSGQKAKETIEKVSAQKNDDLNEIWGK